MTERYEYVGGPHDGEVCVEQDVHWDVFEELPAGSVLVGRYNVTGEVRNGRGVLLWEPLSGPSRPTTSAPQ